MVVGGVGVMPTRTVSFFLKEPLWVNSRHDLDFMPCGHKTFCERSRVILHPADVVAGNGDDADSHGPRMLTRPTRPLIAPAAESSAQPTF
jgi:hypothetical protein